VLRNRVLWACLVGIACASPGEPGPWQSWQSAHDRDHPSTGRIIDVRERRAISPDTLIERLAAARFVLLGEKHDNPDHHRLQAWVIARLAETGARRGVAFEMLSLDVAAALAAQRASNPDDVDGIAAAVDWESRGWPEWSLYRPVFAAALAARFPVFAADLSRADLAQLRKGGSPPGPLRQLGLDEPLPDDALAQLRADLVRSHCGHLPDAALDRVVAIQRARDAQLAAALVASAREDGAVLIAGAGHVGRRWGVARFLERAAPSQPVLAVALVEVDPALRDPEDYLSPPPAFDYLWLTPRVDDRDPCERFREQLRELHPAQLRELHPAPGS
jgi:uncharacterized iron-regulated protein